MSLKCITCNGSAKKTKIFLCIGCPGNECIACGECDCFCTCCEKHNESDCEVCDNEKN